MKKFLGIILLCGLHETVFCWGFYMHQQINYHAVFLLPPQMMMLYKPNIGFLSEHAVDPDKRRYAVATEGAHHFIDIDHYGAYPFYGLPRNWDSALNKFSGDTLRAYGIVPWWIQTMLQRLTKAFRENDQLKILTCSAELGHYIADAHVPLHACSNHNGQLTRQQGIHAFWESRVPELLAEKEWDFFIGKAEYIRDPSAFIWNRILESAAAADTALRCEKEISQAVSEDRKYAFEERNGTVMRQYSSGYSRLYNNRLKGMIERRMRQSIFAVASFWYTAWVNAGQPDLVNMKHKTASEEELQQFEALNLQWKYGKAKGITCEE